MGSTAWHGVMIDITAEHDAKEMLLLHKEDLERRVAERTNELQETNELMSLEIGERRRMEVEVRQVEERYRRLVEDMPGIAYIWEVRPGDEVRSFGYVSPRLHDVLGFSSEEWHASARIHPHDQARGGRGPLSERADRRTVPDGVPLPREGRQRRLGPRPCVLDLTDREREIRPRSKE